ncbi:unnamed protein product [Phaedon cochleariae]|uniref:CUB domain-containing protein n=1 Tax=Phaedon cochleariae TaxID=80249 RepID=A0A9P0GIB9_PHACE|nr:unnamed protein product [Phaedon cochleariae]
MAEETFLVLVLLSSVNAYRYYPEESPRHSFIDIYSNDRHIEDVMKMNFQDNHSHRRPHMIERISDHSGEGNSDMDTIDFHYPRVEFLTKNHEKNVDLVYVPTSSLASLQTLPTVDGVEYADRKRKPRLKMKTNNHSVPEYEPVTLSFVQKIPKPLVPDTNDIKDTKYEELATGTTEHNSDDQNTVKERIHLLLNKYLTNLYSQKFNNSYEVADTTFTADDADVDAKTNYLDKSLLWSLKNKTINKINRFFSLFTILQFNNTQCNVTNSAGSYLGICYTASECSNLGGTAIGNCANGYGVCCVFIGTCGGSAQQNCSYFQSPNYPDFYPPGGAVITPTTAVPPAPTGNPSPTPDPRLPAWYDFQYRDEMGRQRDEMGRYRDDMDSHRDEMGRHRDDMGRQNEELGRQNDEVGRQSNELSRQNDELGRQSDDSLSCVFRVYKVNSDVKRMRIDFLDLELASPTNGTCTTERLVISGQNTNDVITSICGYNTGEHIYVDVSQVFGPLQLMVLSNGVYRKRFRIRVCQFSDPCSEPTSNCLQYYTGVTGIISSLNYNQASMFNRSVPGYFNNLNYGICIRREAGYCSITYTNVRNGVESPFQIPNVDNDGIVTLPRGMAGVDSMDCPNDYIVIAGTRLCGYRFNDGTVNANLTMNAAVTDSSAGPIVIPVRTNSALTGLGFRLYYTQNRCSN